MRPYRGAWAVGIDSGPVGERLGGREGGEGFLKIGHGEPRKLLFLKKALARLRESVLPEVKLGAGCDDKMSISGAKVGAVAASSEAQGVL
jgi:hypothetical protein